jgi:GNAT superfamily N-acetyltransferase
MPLFCLHKVSLMKKISKSKAISVYDPKYHFTSDFNCGNEVLNNFLIKNATNYEKIGASKTYVLSEENIVVGYYSISASTVEPKKIDIRWPRHPIPVLLIGRLAVDSKAHGQGIGRILVADIFQKALIISKIIGCAAVVTEAKDEAAIQFYRKCAFKNFKEDISKLHISMRTISELGS